MAVQFYQEVKFHKGTMERIEKMEAIISEYAAQGFRLTVRQLYYQMVARGFIENTEKSYKNIVKTVTDARLAGLLDWDAIEDRTREFIRLSRWLGGKDILDSAAAGFHMDQWVNQEYRVFVIVEKEALVGVLQEVCAKYDVPLLAARGYPSATVLREFVMSDLYYSNKDIQILHLGDHDPSGIDMTRDLLARIELFIGDKDFQLQRIALNMDQIKKQKPPPNPAKMTDSRFDGYRKKHGDKSWELDALNPTFLAGLVESNIRLFIDSDAWEERSGEIEAVRERLKQAAATFEA